MEKYKDLLKKLKNDLKPSGFIKSQDVFYIKKENNWGLVTFQKSRHADNTIIPFTIELGVCSEKIRSLLQPSFLKPKIEECHWRLRIGQLMEEGKDHWWKLSEFSNLDIFYNEINDILLNKGIPELLKYIADSNLEEAWSKGVSEGLNDFERLIYLTTLLKIYNRTTLRDAGMALKLYSIDKPIEEVADAHLRRLNLYL